MIRPKSVLFQSKAIIIKNTQCSIRNKEIYSEILLPLLGAAMISIKDNENLQFLQIFSPILIFVAIQANPRSLVIHLVEEKAGRFKETQKIMGLKQRAYLLGWVLYSLFKTYLSTILFIAFWTFFVQFTVDQEVIDEHGKYGLQGMQASKFFILYLIYALALLSQSLMMTTFFSDPKLAGEVATFLLLIQVIVSFLSFIEKLQHSFVFILFSLLPGSAVSFVFISASGGLYSLGGLNEKLRDLYSLDDAIIQLSIEAIAYFLLYLYLDQVFPNEYGVAKDPLFFIKDLFVSNKNVAVSDVEQGLIDKDKDINKTLSSQADESSAFYHQALNYQDKQASVIIRGLTKKFGEFKAVDNLGINLYKSEILCLLGHNGAGKTTTISLLTGLLDKTAGKVIINGCDLDERLDYIRECVGICNQRDVLYDDLTVEEQLAFMGKVKGLDGQDLINEMEQIMNTTMLQTERLKIIRSLSGGNKRKLSLAMALIGGSFVVFLDEPTSGMDAMSRRVIWEILERVKQENRTIVLTTHHLDEAEVLADRIAIMAAGKLLACGKCEYIKVNFGEGYQLQITLLTNSIKDSVAELTQKYLSQAVLDPQSSEKTLLYLIPFKAKQNLQKYFEILEREYGQSIQVAFTINSLEDAFINIGMDEEKFIRRARQRNQSSINYTGGNDYSRESRHSFSDEPQFAEQQKEIYVPQCLNRAPVYSFTSQFTAIFLRKYYNTIRSFSNYLAVIIPFLLIIVGTLVVNELDFGNSNPKNFDSYLRQTFISIFIIIAFCFNSSIFIYLPVWERETNLKYALTAMGCRPLPYWLGTFAFDYCLYMIFIVIFLLLSLTFQLDFINDFFFEVLFILMAFGMSYCFFCYFAGLLIYQKASSAMKTFPFFNYFITFGIALDIWFFPCILVWKTDEKNDGVDFMIKSADFFSSLVSPFYAVYQAFQNISDQYQIGDDRVPFPQISYYSYYYTLMLVAQAGIYFLLTLILESIKYNKIHTNGNTARIPFVQKNTIPEEQIMREQEELDRNLKPVSVIKMQKQYSNGYLAIKDITFGVARKQILGLLGPNGAGKSTTFNILTSLIGRTTGQVKIKGVEIDRDQVEVFKDTGICPQFDCIWENLTPPEHLYLFGRMKGLKGQDLKEAVTYFLQTMQLEEYLFRKSGRLSGGNKRKLLVSNAMIGAPSIQFFDEPSTGVDPIARRFLWKTLKQGVQLRDSSVVITTHTMDEAESLCDRIAIMINGEMYCIGSPQELKDRYGEGYNIELKGTALGMEENILTAIKKVFPSAKRIDQNQAEISIIHIPTKEFQFFRAFEVLQSQLCANKWIQDFAINQSSLESVFLQFSKQQNE